jgi:tRNA-splicing ligase RtcB (3'-phosphate/5'-hydroxy nucleic acid ligase)
MKVDSQPNHHPIKMWTDGVEVEDVAMQQLRNVASMPFIHKHIAVMPDVHWGMGATVGSVIPTTGAIIPAAVGVDLGCGMSAVRTNLTSHDLPDNLKTLRSQIECNVPHGRTNNGRSGDLGAWNELPLHVTDTWSTLQKEFRELSDKHPALEKTNHVTHLGTLGTGNHFIEICLDTQDRVWVMLHSGSRGVGNRIGSYFITKAKEEMKRWFCNIPDVDLAYLPEGTEYFDDYVKAVGWAQQFAKVNRELMMAATLDALDKVFPNAGVHATEEAVSCHHNYVSRERHYGKTVWLTRKGAVSAQAGELGIIPGSMGAKSFIVRGKGNRESFHSCSHGAGRRMSRTEAKKTFTVEDHHKATEGIECRKDADVIDETPAAYKSIDAVMAAQTDLVDIVETLRQIVCVKG